MSLNPANHTKHTRPLPSARGIRRTCSKELYRARKRLKQWIAPDLVAQADELYYKKVMLNLPYIAENSSNRKLLSDWFDEHVCPEVAALWGVDPDALGRAFRDAFGG